MDKMKIKDYHIKISNENLELFKRIAIKDKIRLSQAFERAVELFLKIKRVKR